MAEIAAVRDDLTPHDRVYLEQLKLAADVILRLGEDPGGIPDTLQVELFLFRDRVERALLRKPDEAGGTEGAATIRSE